MARNYLETFFRHPFLLLAPVLLGFVAGAMFAVAQPRNYTANASIWTDTSIPDPSTIATTGGNTPPSAGQAALLSQLLTTRSFLESVARNSPVADDLSGLSRVETDYALSQLGTSVSVSTPGPQVLGVSVTMLEPDDAVGVAAAVLEQFEAFQMAKKQERAQAQADYDAERLKEAEQVLETAQREAQTYLEGNPNVDVTDDPTASAVVAAVARAQQDYADASTTYVLSSSALADAEAAILDVLDAPEVAYPQARLKTLALGAGGGLLAGLTVSVLALLALMARDRSVRDAADVKSTLGLDVVAEVPQLKVLPEKSARPASKRHGRRRRAASGPSTRPASAPSETLRA